MSLDGRPLRRTVDGSLRELDEILSKSKLSPLLLLLLLLDETLFVDFLSTDFLLLGLFFFTLMGFALPPSSSASLNSSSSETKRSSSLSAPSRFFCMARKRRYDPRMTSPQSMYLPQVLQLPPRGISSD